LGSVGLTPGFWPRAKGDRAEAEAVLWRLGSVEGGTGRLRAEIVREDGCAAVLRIR